MGRVRRGAGGGRNVAASAAGVAAAAAAASTSTLSLAVFTGLLAFIHLTYARILVPEQQVVAVDVQAVEGKSVELPCNVTPPGHDKVYMVFWFKDDAGIPLYSFDVRGKPLSQARHWSAPKPFGTRAYFRTVQEPAQLVVEDVRRHDEGVYRCRVDFRNTPTRSFRYRLSVIVPPEQPVVLDRWGRTLNATVGPHDEGDDVLLTCRVIGGKPEPAVRWLVNGALVDDEYEHNAGDVIENRLVWNNVGRHDLNSVFSCQANNTNLTEPRETSLTLDLHLRPLTVRILNKQSPLAADRRYEVQCESAGSRPPAVITWYKGKRQMRRVKEETRENVTISDLSFVPTTDDDGKGITCRAENPNITGAYLEASWKIDVVYPPIVSLRLGSTLNPDDIKEGDDVYFECHVKANPVWKKLRWLHNGAVLSHNMSARVIRSNQSLVLQKVTRQSAGRYVCVASNGEGETSSNELEFRVKYAPTCKQERILVVGASRSESLDIACHVETDPPARAFRWKFNNSGETIEVSPERYAATSNGSTSVLRYTPVSDLDYGTLSCWADNDIGSQTAPCVFQVVAAGKPFPVRNCSLWNQTASSVEVVCQAGFDGGLPQVFVLELFAANAPSPRLNLTQVDAPIFLLANLEPDIPFRAVVYAVNTKGRSQGTLLEELTFRDPEKRTAVDGDIPLSPILGMVVGAALTLLTVALIVAAKLRRGRARGGGGRGGVIGGGSVTMTGGGMGTAGTGGMGAAGRPDKLLTTSAPGKEPTAAASLGLGDEKDPDLIPAKFEPGPARPLVGNGNVILRELSPPSYPAPGGPAPSLAAAAAASGLPSGLGPVTSPVPTGGPAPLGNPGTGRWVSPGPPPPPLAAPQPVLPALQPYSWELRPRELRLPPASGPGGYGPPSATLPPSAGTSPASAIAAGALGAPAGAMSAADIELNGVAIKERLMANRLPESCV